MDCRLFILFLALVHVSACLAQSEEQKVLEKGIIGKVFIVDRSKAFYYTDQDGHKHHGYNYDSVSRIYLGAVHTKNGHVVKVIARRHTYGPQPHSHGWIYFFNEKDQYIGQYNMGSPSEVADKLQDGSLVFITSFGTQKCATGRVIKTLSLKKGIPKEFFLGCKNSAGISYGYSE